MKYLALFIFLTLVACGKEGKKENPTPPPIEMITEFQKLQLNNMIEDVEEWTLLCDGIACGERSDGSLDAGDSMLWGGLLCLAGYADQCTATLASQDNGQLFRSPAGTRGINDSSRDMLLGYLAYLVATRNADAARDLASYLRNNAYLLCDNATDNRCQVGPIAHTAIWGTMKRIWLHIGIEPTWEMDQADLTDDSIINIQSKFVFEGYTLHLIGIELLLRQSTDSYSEKLAVAAETLHKRQPENPFYEYLAEGSTKSAAQQVLDKCPRTGDHTRSQWSWQRAEDEKAWEKSKGWDCLFMAKLLLK